MNSDRLPDQEPIETVRPSLVKLTFDVEEMREEVLAGFPSRTDVLRWCQRLTVRTLGEVPTEFYEDVARQFRFAESPRAGRQGVLLAALLQEPARDRELDEAVVEELRRRLVATFVSPAYHRAFRQLRKSAGEYIKESDDEAVHSPRKQRHIAMRPGLDELDRYQSRALTTVLDGIVDEDGEPDRAGVLEWIDDVELATHGELGPGFAERCYKERSTIRLLTTGSREERPARELFAAYHLIPAFNGGVRDLVGRAGELPDVDRARSSPKVV